MRIRITVFVLAILAALVGPGKLLIMQRAEDNLHRHTGDGGVPPFSVIALVIFLLELIPLYLAFAWVSDHYKRLHKL